MRFQKIGGELLNMKAIFEETCNLDYETGHGFYTRDPREFEPVVRIPNKRGILIPFDRAEVASIGVDAYSHLFSRTAEI